MNEFGQGLTVSWIGLLVTFCALGALILIILLLRWLFPARTEGDDSQGGFEINERERLKEQAAAAAVAALLDQQLGTRRASLGAGLEEPVSGWWKGGLDRLLRRN